MFDKRLTIIVPTYNMDSYLERCLSSLVVSENLMSILDVVIIIDGATDGSLEIAKRYVAEYPVAFRVIEKENGNYGSCINRGLEETQGTYVRILDADDWYDTKELQRFLEEIRQLTSDAGCQMPDVLQTPFTCYGTGGSKEVIRYNTMGREPYEYGQVFSLDDILGDGYIRFFLMHGVAYRTEMLREMSYAQATGISYTDTQWACYPFYRARTIVFLNINLYQYDNTREGQTMDSKVLMSSLPQLQKMTDLMLEYYECHISDADISDVRREWLKQYYANRIRIMYKHYLLDMPRQDFDIDVMEEIDSYYCGICQRNDFRVVLFPENKLLRIDYIKYWRKHHQRWPVWLESLNKTLDAVAKYLYVRIIRK